MLTAVDTSILLDLVCGDTAAAEQAEKILARCLQQGSLIVCEAVIAELRPALSEQDLREFLADWQIKFVPSSIETGLLAGQMFAAYLERKGPQRRVIADFLIGAHALHFAKRLCARDRGYWRDYFNELLVVAPA
jgi:predicted nucleic acid-binding protein